MDRRTITVMVLMLALFLGYQFYLGKLKQEHPEWYPEENKQPVPPPQSQPAGTRPATTQAGATQASTTSAPISIEATSKPATDQKPALRCGPSDLAKIRSTPLGSTTKPSPYVVGVEVDPTGASIASVTLNRFTQTVDKPEPYVFQKPYPQADPRSRAFATRSVKVEGYGDALNIADAQWALESATTRPAVGVQSATYVITILDSADKPVLEIRKVFRVAPEPADDKTAGLGYEITIEHQIRNLSGKPLGPVTLTFNGPTAPPKAETKVGSEVVVGYSANQGKAVEMEHIPFSALGEKQKSKDLKNEKGEKPILWAGITTAYFDAIVLPQGKALGATPGVVAEALNPSSEAEDRDAALIFTLTRSDPLKDGETASGPLSVYLGPKQRAILNDDHFSGYPRAYDKTLVLTGGPCGYCTFPWLIDILVNMLRAFHAVLNDWGLAIITLVLIVRAVLHPITKRSQVSMSKMTKMGPEMERIKKKYADQPDELKRAQAELMKEQGLTPILGCLPMLLQMPIWIALWSSLQSTFELRQAPFLWGLTWIKDLSQPDFLKQFHEPVKLFFGWTVSGINLLPILMAVVFWLQQKMTPKPVATSKEQEQQQKMMQWMSLLFPVFLYNSPSGLNLYILTSTTIGIFESKIVRDHVKKKEEEEKAGKVIVDAPQTRAAKRMAADKKEEPRKKAGLAGWLADLQSKAEDIAKRQKKK